MGKILTKIYDHTQSDSWTASLRKKRMVLFTSLLSSIPTPVKIIDIGGRPNFWNEVNFGDPSANGLEITVVNVNPRVAEVNHPNIKSIVGDARNLKDFKDKEFDVAFSNSVIEHVGDYNNQRQMANEVRRVGKRYFVQTPNLYFPIEPHFVLPLFQFLPMEHRVWLLMNIGSIRSGKKATDKEKARNLASSITLLSKKEFMNLFPGANLWEEKFWGLTKSFIVYGGW